MVIKSQVKGLRLRAEIRFNNCYEDHNYIDIDESELGGEYYIKKIDDFVVIKVHKCE